jgi:hypothetical protein
MSNYYPGGFVPPGGLGYGGVGLGGVPYGGVPCGGVSYGGYPGGCVPGGVYGGYPGSCVPGMIAPVSTTSVIETPAVVQETFITPPVTSVVGGANVYQKPGIFPHKHHYPQNVYGPRYL